MQTIVMKISLTVDPVKLVAWAKAQMGVCCSYPAHDPALLDFMEPELQAQFILGHTFLSTIPEEITDGGCAETLETGIPPEIVARIDREYQEALAKLMTPCDNCGQPATEGFVDNPFLADVHGEIKKQWYCEQCHQSDLDGI